MLEDSPQKGAREGEAVENIGGVTDYSIVVMQGPGKEFVIPKMHVEGFYGAEVRLDPSYKELEASYKIVAD